MSKKIKIAEKEDNVATALHDIAADQTLEVLTDGVESKITVRENIQFGHKVAIEQIDEGDDVIKYGLVIGAATDDIVAGDHVHIHNVESFYGRGDKATAE